MNESKLSIQKKGNNYEKEFYYAYHPRDSKGFSDDCNGHVHRMGFHQLAECRLQ